LAWAAVEEQGNNHLPSLHEGPIVITALKESYF